RRSLAKLSTDFSKAMASADRISEVLDTEPEIQDRPDAIEATSVRGDIEFRGVSFDYGDGKDVLRQVSFKIARGQRLALVGASGAGKSTIVSLILRLYEAQEGAILLDGVDIRQYRRESLRRQIGLVLQQSLLFGATIRENIAYGRPEASADEIMAAAKAANAHEFIRQLEDGYDTVIGERGAAGTGACTRSISGSRRATCSDEPGDGGDEPTPAGAPGWLPGRPGLPSARGRQRSGADARAVPPPSRAGGGKTLSHRELRPVAVPVPPVHRALRAAVHVAPARARHRPPLGAGSDRPDLRPEGHGSAAVAGGAGHRSGPGDPGRPADG